MGVFADDYVNQTNAVKALMIPDTLYEDTNTDVGLGDRLNILYTSTVYGTLNNFIELGKWSGIADEDTEIYDIEQMLSDERYELGLEYAKNKWSYDFVGGLVASAAPIGATMWGIRALKAAATSGKVGNLSSKIVAPYVKAEAAKNVYIAEAAKLGSEPSLQALSVFKKAKHDMWKYTTIQQAYEGALVGSAVEFSLHSGHVLNNDSLTGAQALANIGAGIAFGAVFQGAVGGVWAGRGAASEALRARLHSIEVNELNYIKPVILGAGNAGDKVAAQLTSYNLIHGSAPTNAMQITARDGALTRMESEITQSVKQLYAPSLLKSLGNDGVKRDAFMNNIKTMLQDPTSRADLASRLQGATVIRAANASDSQARVTAMQGAAGKLAAQPVSATLDVLKGAKPIDSLHGMTTKEYDRLVARLTSTPTGGDLDISDIQSIMDFVSHKALNTATTAAKTKPAFEAESAAIYTAHGIPMHMHAEDAFDGFDSWYQLYNMRAEMKPIEFAKLYPTYEQVFKDIGEKADDLFSRKRTLYTNLQTGAVTGDIGLHLGDMGATDITQISMRIGSNHVLAVNNKVNPSSDLLEYQAQRVMASRAKNTLTIGSKAAPATAWSDMYRLEAALLETPNTTEIVINGTRRDAESALNELAAFKAGEYNKLLAANPKASADELANTLGVSEKFVAASGRMGKFTDASGNSWTVGVNDVLRSADDLLKPKHYAIDYIAQPYHAKHGPEIWAYMTGEASKARVARQAAVASNMLDAEQLASLPSSIPVEAVLGYNEKRFLTNTAQIGEYNGLEQWAAYIGDLTMRWAREEVRALRSNLVTSSDVVIRDTKANAEIAAVTEWYARQIDDLFHASPEVILPESQRAAWKQAEKAGVTAESFAQQQTRGTTWVFKNQEASHYLRSFNKVVYDKVNVPAHAMHQATGAAYKLRADRFFLPPRDEPFSTFVVVKTRNPLAATEEVVHRVTAGSKAELATKLHEVTKDLTKGQYTEIARGDVDLFSQVQKRWEFGGTREQVKAGMSLAPSLAPEADAGRIIQGHNEWLARQIETKYGNAIELQYADEFAILKRMADDTNRLLEGRPTKGVPGIKILQGSGKTTQRSISDYDTIMATMRGGDLSNPSMWKDINNSVEAYGASVWASVARIFRGGKIHELARKSKSIVTGLNVDDEATRLTKYQATADAMVSRLKEAGIEVNLGNYIATRLTQETHVDPLAVRELVSAANRAQSTMMFRLDLADAAMNVLGAMTKGAGELTYLISRRNKLSDTTVFDREMDRLLGARVVGESPPELHIGKALSEGFAELFSPEGKELMRRYVDKGLMQEKHHILRESFEDMRIDASGLTPENISGWRAKFVAGGSKIFNISTHPSDFANMSVQFSALRMAERLGTASGLRGADLDAVMWTYNRRVNSITNPRHKPRIFQGALGMSVGVYQSYMFHMLANLGRYAAYDVKAAPAAIVALNSTFFGADSVPGFNQFNQLVAEHNQSNSDVYGAITAVAGGDLQGRDLSDFLLYGAGAALLQNNMFVRGDLNPRNATILPTSLWDLPSVSAVKRVLDSIGVAGQRITHGESFAPTVADAVAGLGLNRPLRGIVEVYKGRSVDGNDATVTYHEDVWDLTTVTRLAGLRPLNEGIVREYQSRLYSVKASQYKVRKELGSHIRRMYDEKGEEAFTPVQMENWMKMYQNANGSASNFDTFLHDQLTKGDLELSTRLESLVSKNPHAIAQYRAIVGEAD